MWFESGYPSAEINYNFMEAIWKDFFWALLSDFGPWSPKSGQKLVSILILRYIRWIMSRIEGGWEKGCNTVCHSVNYGHYGI